MGAQVITQRNQCSWRLAAPALGAFILVLSGGAARAQEADTAAAAAEPAPQVQVQRANSQVEEVIVTGQRTFQSLISEAARETENFYARLNVVVDRPEFEITCRNELPAGSNIRTKVCRMRYQEELDSRGALSLIQGMQGITDADGNSVGSVMRGTPYNINPEARRMQDEFELAMLEAVNTDAELNASVVRLMQLKSAVDNYQTSRQERRE